jgi:biotin operon repressor
MTQTEMIRAHLQSGRDLSPIDALNHYGCFRLAARIKELRNQGLPIETLTEQRNGKAWAKYRLTGQMVLL